MCVCVCVCVCVLTKLRKVCRGSRLGVIAKVLSKSFEVSEFELHSRYYVRVRTNTFRISEGGRSVMVIVVRNERDDTSSNLDGADCIFTKHKYSWVRYESNYSPSSYG